jgi:putative FmdB family regulatory protein
MPIYEYECTACKHRFDRYQTFSEAPVTSCPECGNPVRKVLQPVGIVFKGSGWYKNDSRSTSTNGKADAAKEAASGASPEAKASGEAKPDTSGKAESAAKSDTGKSDSSKSDGKNKSGASGKAESASKPVPAASNSAS